MRPLDDCIKKEKSKADEMFEELGYKKVTEHPEFSMLKKGMTVITFHKKDKLIAINTDTGEEIFGNTIYGFTEISMQELQAINEKVKELGWYE